MSQVAQTVERRPEDTFAPSVTASHGPRVAGATPALGLSVSRVIKPYRDGPYWVYAWNYGLTSAEAWRRYRADKRRADNGTVR